MISQLLLTFSDPSRRRWWSLALVGMAFLMTILDSTSMLAAIPSIEDSLRLTLEETQWTITAYAIAFSGPLLVFGRLADRFGPRRMLIIGMSVRILAALACGLATSPEFLIIARAVQGASAAIIAPAALSIVVILFREGPERNKALGIWAGLGAVGATTGLLLGGVLTDTWGWHWVFWINIPAGILVIAASPRLLSSDRKAEVARPSGLLSGMLLTSVLALSVFAITRTPTVGLLNWSTGGVSVLAALLTIILVHIERSAAQPLIPRAWTRSRAIVGGNLGVLFAGIVVNGMLITLTAHAQLTLKWSAIEFGLVTAVMTITSIVGSTLAQRIVRRAGLRNLVALGMAFLAVACLTLAETVASNGGQFWLLFIALVIFGVGLGGVMVGSQISALTGVEELNSGTAAGLVDTSFSIGAALGVAICSSVAATTLESNVGQGWGFGAAAIIAVIGGLTSPLLPKGRTTRSTTLRKSQLESSSE